MKKIHRGSDVSAVFNFKELSISEVQNIYFLLLDPVGNIVKQMATTEVLPDFPSEDVTVVDDNTVEVRVKRDETEELSYGKYTFQVRVAYLNSDFTDSVELRSDAYPTFRVVASYEKTREGDGVDLNFQIGGSDVNSVNGRTGHVVVKELPSGTKGDIAYHDGNDWVTLTVGGDGQTLSSLDGVPLWKDAPSNLPTGEHGSVLYHNGTDWVSLGAGNEGEVLSTNGVGEAPSWKEVSGGGGGETKPEITTENFISPTYNVDMNINEQPIVSIQDGETAISISITPSTDTATARTEREVILDNSSNNSAISSLTFDETHGLMFEDGDPVLGIAANAVLNLTIINVRENMFLIKTNPAKLV